MWRWRREFICDIVDPILLNQWVIHAHHMLFLSHSLSLSLSLSLLASLGGISMNIKKEKEVGSEVSMGDSEQI